MTTYRCDVCRVYEYDDSRGDSKKDIKPGTDPVDFSDDWKCPICNSDKTHLKPVEKVEKEVKIKDETIECAVCGAANRISNQTEEVDLGAYLGEWERPFDELESNMKDIHRMSVTGESVIEPMRTRKDVVSWDDVLIKGAQLAKIPLNKEDDVNSRTIIGPNAKQPLVIDTPVFITHMSFGALSREAKVALARGAQPCTPPSVLEKAAYWRNLLRTPTSTSSNTFPINTASPTRT